MLMLVLALAAAAATPPPPPHVLLLEHADDLGVDDDAVVRMEARVRAAGLDARREALATLRPGDAGFALALGSLLEAEMLMMDDLRAELTETQWAAARAFLPPPPPGLPLPPEPGAPAR